MDFKDPSVMYTVIIGYLVKNEGIRIQPAKFNKLADRLGLDKQSKAGIQDIVNHAQEEKELTEVYEQAYRGDIGIEDLEEVGSEGDKPFEDEKEVETTLATYVKANEITKADMREFRTLQRDQARLEVLLDHFYHKELKDVLSSVTKPLVSRPKIQVGDSQDSELVILPTDWHIGAQVNLYRGNKYNYSVFKQRLQEYINSVLDEVKLFKPSKLHIYHLGDFIEHINMRDVDQPFFAEFTGSHQIALALRAIITLVRQLSQTGIPIELGMIAGNHDSLEGTKKNRIYGDSFVYVILDSILLMKEQGLLPGVNIIDNRKNIYRLNTKINGRNILCIHGDKLPKGKSKIPSLIKDDSIDYLFYGHFHQWSIQQEDYKRFSMMCPSIMGYNSYSETLNLPSSSPSQACVLIKENGDPVFLPTFFKE